MIQSVLFDRNLFTFTDAKHWLTRHGYVINTAPSNLITKNYFRFRQIEPKKNYKYKNKKIANGIYFVMAY